MGGNSKGSGKHGASNGPEGQASTGAATGKADQYVPVFDNSQRSYKEFRKRCELYRVKMELEGRQQETIFNIVTLLTGKAWDMVDDLTTATLQGDGGYDAVFERLDHGFRYEPLTELPEDFETFFVKLTRKANQTLQEYAADFSRAERQLRVTHSVELPQKVLAWWFLRRSGIGREQRQLVLTNVGADNLTLENVQKAMNFILGQDSRLDTRWARTKADAFYQDEIPDDGPDFYEDDEPTYWQEEGDYSQPWPDEGEDYYDHDPGPQTEDVFDVDEFDEIYASYTDAKSKLNNLRVSRGFYPVVALVDRGGNNAVRQGGAGKGRGKARRDKGRGKGAGGKQGPLSPKGSTAKARGQQAVGRQICLRCGQAGHWARNCPQASADKKRKIDGGDDEVMMVAETYNLNDEDLEEEMNNRAMQDGGAASVLGSATAIRSYLRYLLEKGVDLATIPCFRCSKGFRFGNSSTGGSRHCLLLPLTLEGRKLQILTYVIEGNAPLLFGRPLLKQLGVIVDYEKEKMKVKDGQWQDIPLGPRGEHQLILSEDVTRLLDNSSFDEILVPDDYENHVGTHDPIALEEILELSEPALAYEEVSLVKHYHDETGDPLHETEPNDNKNVTASTPTSAHDSDTQVPTGGTDNATRRTKTNDTTATHHDNKETVTVADNKETVTFANDKETVTFANDKETVTSANDKANKYKDTTATHHDKETVTLTGDKVKALSKGRLRGLIMVAQAANKKHKSLLSQANRVGNDGHRVVWQVFTGKGRLEEAICKQGGKVKNFSKETGWNFAQPKMRKRFLAKLQEEQPDEVMIAPSGRIWSPAVDLSVAADPGRAPELRRLRQDNHDNILVFAAVIFETQRRAGRHAHIEQAWNSRAWMTKALARLQGHSTYVDQCEYGLSLPDNKGEPRPIRRATCFFTTKQNLARCLEKRCSGKHHHTNTAENQEQTSSDYPPELAETLASLLLQKEGTDAVYATSSEPMNDELESQDKEPADNTKDVSRKNRDEEPTDNTEDVSRKNVRKWAARP